MAGKNCYVLNYPIAAFIAAFFLGILSVIAEPTADRIGTLAEEAKSIADTFMRQTVELRLEYEYKERFVTEASKEKLCALARKASDELNTIIESQQFLKAQIEDYQGSDWDRRYGTTGLWRKAFADLHTTILLKCQIDYYAVLAAEQPEKDKILYRICDQIDLLEQAIGRTAAVEFLRAGVFMLLAETDYKFKKSAAGQLDLVLTTPDAPEQLLFAVEIAKLKLSYHLAATQLNELARKLVQSGCSDDFELNMSLAFLQRRAGSADAVERIVDRWPQAKDFLGRIILFDLSGQLENGRLTRQTLDRLGVFEAECAAKAALDNAAEKYRVLLGELTNVEKLRTPLILYTAAIANIQHSPAEAVRFFIEAGKVLQLPKKVPLNINAEETYRRAVEISLELFQEDSNYCSLAQQALESYLSLPGAQRAEEFEYIYAVVLTSCGRHRKSTALLEKIASQSDNEFSDIAQCELLLRKLSKQQSGDLRGTSEIIERLDKLITGIITNQRQLICFRPDIVFDYCQILLDLKNDGFTRKALHILDHVEFLSDRHLYMLKTRALQQLGKPNQAAGYLLLAVEEGCCDYAVQVAALLSEIIERIDDYQANDPEFKTLLNNCCKLCQHCLNCTEVRSNPDVGLMAAEFSVFAADKKPDKLANIENSLAALAGQVEPGNVDFLRCRARLLTAQRKYSRAAQVWSSICNIRKGQPTSAARRSWRWWRSKFYQLYCLAQTPTRPPEDILHIIEVTEHSFVDIPPLWAHQLNLLRAEQIKRIDSAGPGSK